MKKEKTKPKAALTDTEKVYNKLENDGVMFFNYCHMRHAASTLHNQYGYAMFINERLVNTTAEEKYAVLHEWAHIETGTLHRVGATPYQIECDEYAADRYVAYHWMPIDEVKLILSYDGIGTYELAEYFNFPLRFAVRVLSIYREEGLL